LIAHADSGTGKAKAVVKAGALSFSNTKNNVSLSVNKTIHLISYSLPISVVDARGSGKGWNLSITSTLFKASDGKSTLSSNASSISGVNASCGIHSTCTSPIDTVSYPLTIPAGNPTPPSVKFFDAAVSSGLGVFRLAMMVNVTIPANTKNDTYTSTITLKIANGP
jgi:hypothetical protein